MTTLDARHPLLTGRPSTVAPPSTATPTVTLPSHAEALPVAGAPPIPQEDARVLPGHATPAPARALVLRRRREAAHRRLVLVGDFAVLAGMWMVLVVADATHGATPAVGIAAAVWWLCLAASRSHDPLVPLPREIGRTAVGTGAALGAIAVATVLIASAAPSPTIDVDWLATLLSLAPVAFLGLAAVRVLWRRRLAALLRVGDHVARAVVVGTAAEVATLERALTRSAQIRICGTVVWDERALADGSTARRQAVSAAVSLRADTVIVARAPAGPGFLRRLAWELEGTAAEIMVWPGIADVASPRLRVHRSGDVLLLRVAQPAYDIRRAAKRTLDIVVAALAFVPISIASLPIAIAIRLESRGTILFRQDRVGEGGRLFSMLKFRSMTADAESVQATLIAENEAAGPLFKMHDDPRVTRVGRILRRYSLDELPQFWNVLMGDMSVIGPRPALPSEVAEYEDDERRRLYVKPGISGPWQVGGRSDLGWERGIALDLDYVENHSIARDVGLMARTVQAVVRPRGAY